MLQSKRKNLFLQKILPKIRLNKSNKFVFVGVGLVAFSGIVLLSLIFPILRAEFSYLFSKGQNVIVVGRNEALAAGGAPSGVEIVKPVDENFGIVIPKIEANAKVIPDVDAENPAIYQPALTKGVAQAAGSANPGEEGNVFIFTHSGQDALESSRYNAVFYLLSKLEKGDEIFLFFQNRKYRYVVTEMKTVSPDEVEYMAETPGKNTLTLMTCWPGGTTWKRLIVKAEQK